MKSLVLMAFSMALTLCPAYALSGDVLWETYIERAEQALQAKHYLEAKRLFSVSLAEAKRCSQVIQLARRLDRLADDYAAKNHPRVAEVLRRQARQIFRHRSASGNLCLAETIQDIVKF